MNPYALLFVMLGICSFGFYAYREQERDVPIHVVKPIAIPHHQFVHRGDLK